MAAENLAKGKSKNGGQRPQVMPSATGLRCGDRSCWRKIGEVSGKNQQSTGAVKRCRFNDAETLNGTSKTSERKPPPNLETLIPDADHDFSLTYVREGSPQSEDIPLAKEEKWPTLPTWITLSAERKTRPMPLCFNGHPLCQSTCTVDNSSCYKCGMKPIPLGTPTLWCKTCDFWSICEECVSLPRQLSLQDDPLFHGPEDPCIVEWSSCSCAQACNGTVIVCPGGNYEFLIPDEGQPVVKWLSTHGIYGCVLRYRLLPRFRLDDALDDLAAAIDLVRKKRGGPVIGLGFSAGGHLLANLAIRNAARKEEPAAAGLDGQMLLYAGIDGTDWLDPWQCGFVDWAACLKGAPSLLAHQPALLGGPGFAAPPTFMAYSIFDTTCPPAKHGDRYALALDAESIPYTYMRADYGEHGFSIWNGWVTEGLKWMRAQGLK